MEVLITTRTIICRKLRKKQRNMRLREMAEYKIKGHLLNAL